jgi:hypothetical protein
MNIDNAKKDITLDELRSSYDWEEVFGEGSGGNTTRDIDSIDGTGTSPFTRQDVVEVIAAVNGENDGSEWVGVFRLADDRYLAAMGWCDYTGWDCRAGNTLTVAETLETAVRFGLSDEARRLLNIEL